MTSFSTLRRKRVERLLSTLSRRRQAGRVQDPARQGADRRGAGDARRPRPRRQGLRRSARRARRGAGQRPVTSRLRLDAARRGGDAGAGRRSRNDLGRIARRPDRARRRRARARPFGARLDQHSGGRLAGGRRRGAGSAEGAEPVHGRRTAGRRRDQSQMGRLRAWPEADHDRQRRQGDG